MRLYDKEIGTGKVFVIAEAGINHNGSLPRAMEMIECAKRCGADAVKFQKRDLSSLYRKTCLDKPSDESHSLGVYIPILRSCELSEDDHLKLMAKCKQVGIKYMCSPWDIESIEFLDEMGVEAFKVPSACFSDVFMMERLATKIKPVILSTGMHTEKEISLLMSIYGKLFKDNMALMHCVSSYPTADRDVNLGFIKYLKNEYNVPVGYSGHERGIPVTIAAIASGATIIERHFTLDRTLPGPDHAASLEPHGLETLIRHIRAVENALGTAKNVNRGEIVARETLGKVLTYARTHARGDYVSKDSFKATSPGYGIPPYEVYKYLGEGLNFKLTRDVSVNEIVKDDDLKGEAE